MKKLLLLAGDGIGPEIMQQAKKLIALFQEKGLQLQIDEALIGGCAVDKYGSPYPEETKIKAANSDVILLGAVGGYKWDNLPRPQRPETGLLEIRRHLQLFANLRPAKIIRGLENRSSLKEELVAGLDLLIVRELTGGIYFGQPRAQEMRDGQRVAYNTLIYSEDEIRRIGRVAFESAQRRSGRLCSIDKMNVLESSQLWREIISDLGKEYPKVELSHMLVDNAAMQLVRNPKQFDVIVTGNLFGDILSDEASMLTGSIGLLPSASLGQGGKGLYEPIHGSAPDIAGKNIANPYAMLLSLALMLRHSFNELTLAAKLESAIEECIGEGICSIDISEDKNKYFSTDEIGNAVVKKLIVRL